MYYLYIVSYITKKVARKLPVSWNCSTVPKAEKPNFSLGLYLLRPALGEFTAQNPPAAFIKLDLRLRMVVALNA